MKRTMIMSGTFVLLLLFFMVTEVPAQAVSHVQHLFPAGTVVFSNVPYAGDTLKRHQLDVYLPEKAGRNTPLVVWVHGGAWMLNDKYADMGYMKNTVRGFLDSGYALASIDYRYSTEAPFPAQIQDCNQALEFLYQHADRYKIDKERMAVIGFSAGGHLASLLALSNNTPVKAFYPAGSGGHFRIRCVLDFYGPSDFIMLASNPDTAISNMRDPVAILLGALPVDRPDLAKIASPVTYVDRDDPPFLIVQGEKDESVPNTQSKILHSWLTLAGVKNELIIVPNAPHYGEMFDAEYIRKKVFEYLRGYLR
ncbi:MAG TPA: alpha/beta hydrolase [Puia sp.]|nr:alpha/beta hydrolase [Puia sp.]